MKKIVELISSILLLPVILIIMVVVFIFTYICNIFTPEQNKLKENLDRMYKDNIE